ncbi:MAG TPA: YCF48-related protein [Bacteroidia bacterium]|nr:YCF48-related protein [Bacteroidia bacterium]
MKKFSTFFTAINIIGLLLLSTSSEAQWQYVNPKPQGNNLNSSVFVSATIGWIAGDYGTIIKTADGGNTWTNQYCLQNKNIIDFSAINTNSLFFIASDNQLYGSSNGGNSWSKKFKFLSSNVTSLSFLTANEGWATQGSSIEHTTDGGLTWNSQTVLPGETFASVKIASNGEGFAVSTSGTILKYSNTGQTWSTVNSIAGTYKAMAILQSGTTGLIVINSTLYKSSNSGFTWNDPVTTPTEFGTSNVSGLYILSSSDYYATLANGTIVYSHNGGSTWSANTDFSGYQLNGIVATQLNEGIAFGNNGIIVKTTNNGLNWNRIGNLLSTEILNGVTSISSDVYAIGNTGTILKSNNSGNTWSSLNSGTSENLKDIIAINSSNLLAVGENGTIIKSTNAGTNWNTISTTTIGSLFGLSAKPNGTIYAVGSDDIILSSTDIGNTWNDITTSFTGFGYTFKEIQFVNNDTGFIATNSAEILMTDDGGQNWYLKTTGAFGQISCLFFQNGNSGWIGTEAGEIFNTNDGGNSWNNQSIANFSGSINKLRFTDVLNGWAFTNSGIYRTADGGNTWNREFSPYPDLKDAVFINNIIAVAVGSGNATILQKTNELVLNLSNTTFCTDHTYTIVANSSGTFNPGNMFEVQLSDDFGDFSNPLSVGSLFATSISSLPIAIPGGITSSSAYKMRIASTNPPMYSAITGTVINIHTSPQSFIVANGPTVFCPGGSVILSNLVLGSAQYQWFKNGVTISGANNDSLLVSTTGNYTLNVNDGICETLSPIMDVLVINCTGIGEQDQKKVMIAPNPADDFLNISIANGINYTKLSIMEMTGRTIQEFEGPVSQKTRIDVSQLPAGVYLIKLSGTDDSIVRFVKK